MYKKILLLMSLGLSFGSSKNALAMQYESYPHEFDEDIRLLCSHDSSPWKEIWKSNSMRLFKAIVSSDIKTIKQILNKFNVDDKIERVFLTPVQLACGFSDLKAVKCLVELGARFNIGNEKDGTTPFCYALQYGKKEIVEYLVKNKLAHTPEIINPVKDECMDVYLTVNYRGNVLYDEDFEQDGKSSKSSTQGIFEYIESDACFLEE